MLKATKVTALVIIPVLCAAFVILFFFPGRTQQLWAWTMKPDMTPINMGAGYLGGAWFFTRVALNKHPRRVAGGLGAATIFTLLLGAATFIHWEKFNYDHISFWAWLSLYVVSPVLLPILALANWRAGAADDEPADAVEIPGWARTILAVVGGVTVLGAAMVFAAPSLAIETWPWTVTDLTARSLSAYVAFTGLFLLTPLLDRRWTSARIGIEAVTIGLVMTGSGALRARDDFKGPDASVAGFAAALLALLAFVVYLQLRLSRPREASARVPPQL
ncbi:MAG: hypothetical protein ABIS21_00730 [Acidimicrobiales bacterium]